MLAVWFSATQAQNSINVGTSPDGSDVVENGVVNAQYGFSTHSVLDPCKSYWKEFYVKMANGGNFPLNKSTTHVISNNPSVGDASGYALDGSGHLGVHFTCKEVRIPCNCFLLVASSILTRLLVLDWKRYRKSHLQKSHISTTADLHFLGERMRVVPNMVSYSFATVHMLVNPQHSITNSIRSTVASENMSHSQEGES